MLSALRRAPISSRSDLYPLIDDTDFNFLLDREREQIGAEAFNKWHESTTLDIIDREHRLEGQVGWAAKIINIYLKTACYVGTLGRKGIRDCLHPPIDAGLWSGIQWEFHDRPEILHLTHHVATIGAVQNYEDYRVLLRGFQLVADELHCRLIEIEQLWRGTDLPGGG